MFDTRRIHIIITNTCTLLPRNQSFYRKITSQEKDGAVSGGRPVVRTAREYKIVVTLYRYTFQTVRVINSSNGTVSKEQVVLSKRASFVWKNVLNLTNGGLSHLSLFEVCFPIM